MELDPKTEKKAAEIAPALKPLEVQKRLNILDRWELTVDELTEIVDANPSMRGLMLGYVAEHVLRKTFFTDSRLSEIGKHDDHDRKNKGDLKFAYRGRKFKVECKSLQTNQIKKLDGKHFKATYQCDASDRRPVRFRNGSKIETTCLLVGEFDIIAVNLFALENKWRFAFALNADLPRSRHKKYTQYQRKYLLSSSMPITWPLDHPYVDDPYRLMDLVINGQARLPRPASIL